MRGILEIEARWKKDLVNYAGSASRGMRGLIREGRYLIVSQTFRQDCLIARSKRFFERNADDFRHSRGVKGFVSDVFRRHFSVVLNVKPYLVATLHP